MAPRCSICRHAKRAEIERGVGNGLSYRTVAKRYSVSHSSIDRHVKNCIGGADSFRSGGLVPLYGDVEVIHDIEYSDDPVKLLEHLTRSSFDGMNRMTRRGDDMLAIAYGKEVRATLAMKLELEAHRASKPEIAFSAAREKIYQDQRNRAATVEKELKRDGLLIDLFDRLQAKAEERAAAAEDNQELVAPPIRKRTRP